MKRGPKGWLARDAALAAKQASHPSLASNSSGATSPMSSESSFSSLAASTAASSSDEPPPCLCRAHAQAAEGGSRVLVKTQQREPVGYLAWFAWCADDGASDVAAAGRQQTMKSQRLLAKTVMQ